MRAAEEFGPLTLTADHAHGQEGYDVACRDPVCWQQWYKHTKAGDSKVDIEQPSQQLEGVWGPAPAIGP